jgi:hypothetical protein
VIEMIPASPRTSSSWPHMLIQRLIVVIATVLLGWGAIMIGVSGIARLRNPELALWMSPTDSRALSNLADRLLIEKSLASGIGRSKQLARAALLNDPTNVAALRVLGFAAPKQDQLAIFQLSNRLSARDLATQLWLIEYYVGRDDAALALTHYDTALRTSSVAPQLLFPVLAKASADETLAPQIAALLAKRPPWALAFLSDLLASSPSDDTLLTIFRQVARSSPELPQVFTDGLTTRMLRDYRFDLVRDAYFVAGGTDKAIGKRVKNGNLSSDPTLLPFDWTFTADEKIDAGRSPNENVANDLRLVIQASEGTAGEAARQLLMLSPGRYALTSTAGSVPSQKQAQLAWHMTCATKTGAKFHEMTLLQSASAGLTSKSEFSVPSLNCPAQWLSLRVTTQTDSDEFVAWVDNVTVMSVQ